MARRFRRGLTIAAAVTLLLAFAALCLPVPAAKAPETKRFELPASLRMIGEEAFAGTSAGMVVLPDSTETVEESAFAGMEALTAAVLPSGAADIHDRAFGSAADLTIYGEPGSSAEDWALRNGYRFRSILLLSSALLPSAAIGLLRQAVITLSAAAAAGLCFVLIRRAAAEMPSLWKRKSADLIAYYGFS